MSGKKKIRELIERSKNKVLAPDVIEAVLLDKKCIKYLEANPKILATLYDLYQHSLIAMAEEISQASRLSFINLDKITNYLDGDKKPLSHKHYIAVHNSIKNYIINDILKYSDIDTRTFAVERWVSIMQYFEITGDFNSYMAAISAIKTITHYLRTTSFGLSKKAYIYFVNEVINVLNMQPNVRSNYFQAKHTTKLITPYFGDYRSIFLRLSETNNLLIEKINKEYKIDKFRQEERDELLQTGSDRYKEALNNKSQYLNNLKTINQLFYPSNSTTSIVSDLVTEVSDRELDIVQICRLMEDKATDSAARENKSSIFQDSIYTDFVFYDRKKIQFMYHTFLLNRLNDESLKLLSSFNQLKSIINHESNNPLQLAKTYIAYRSDIKNLEVNYNAIIDVNSDIKKYIKTLPSTDAVELLKITKCIDEYMLGKSPNEKDLVNEMESYAVMLARQAYNKSKNFKLNMPDSAENTDVVARNDSSEFLEYQSALELARVARKNAETARKNIYRSDITMFIEKCNEAYQANSSVTTNQSSFITQGIFKPSSESKNIEMRPTQSEDSSLTSSKTL